MPELINRSWTLANRPVGYPQESDFVIAESEVEDPLNGEILVRTLYMSLDPYMRGRLRDRRSYAVPVGIGDVIVGEGVGRVVASQSDEVSVGDIVACQIGWQEYAVIPAHTARVVDPSVAPVSTALGVIGMPGLTAYHGLLAVGRPRPGETVLVSAASGAVGAVVGQIAKMTGCRVIGTVGSDEKADYCTQELGFDAAVNYKTEDVFARIAELAPDGIDIYFDNVGGPVTDAAIENLALRGRVLVCGQISQYNLEEPELAPRNLWNLITKQARIEGFIVFNFQNEHEVARARLASWVRDGSLKYREDIVDGFEQAPRAFIGLMNGANFGKLLVKVSD
jgi:NADPH-dependent curcumin reductase CurA